jgi:hypothetical protein
MATAAESTATTTDADPAASRPLRGATLYAAIAVLIAFAVLVAYLVGEVDTDDEVRWTRLAWLFASVEAIAFGAAGALFGASVHRERAQRAEAAAKENAEAAANGRALAAALKAEDSSAGSGAGLESFEEQRPSEAARLAKRHAELARSLFP